MIDTLPLLVYLTTVTEKKTTDKRQHIWVYEWQNDLLEKLSEKTDTPKVGIIRLICSNKADHLKQIKVRTNRKKTNTFGIFNRKEPIKGTNKKRDLSRYVRDKITEWVDSG